MAEQELARLVGDYRRRAGLTQEAVAVRLSAVLGRRVQQSQVSENEKGSRWSDPDLPGAYVRALEIPVEDMMAATGYPDPDPTKRRQPTLEDLIKRDPALTPAAQRHLLDQYQLLKLASMQERAGRPVLPENSARSRRSAAG